MSDAKSLFFGHENFLFNKNILGKFAKKAYFGHEVSPHLQINIKWINWENFMTDARS